MKEFPTEEQAHLFVLWLSVLVTLGGLAYGFWRGPRVPPSERKNLWLDSGLIAVLGPVIWGFWGVYNSIEDHYGLDSLKALEINFFIAIGIGFFFVALRVLAPRYLGGNPLSVSEAGPKDGPKKKRARKK